MLLIMWSRSHYIEWETRRNALMVNQLLANYYCRGQENNVK